MKLPRLRQLDIFPIEYEEKDLFCLHDGEGYASGDLILSPGAVFVATLLDGERDAEAIQQLFARETGGHHIEIYEINALVHQLDEAGFLESEHFTAIRQGVFDAYRQAPARPAYCAGHAYPADPQALSDWLLSFFHAEGGPGEAPDEAGKGPHVRGIIAPHIDFSRGGPVYAHSYLHLYRSGRPETVLIFGVAHNGGMEPFILTRKGYETPFGTLEADNALIDTLAAACAWDPYASEIVHRTEHSIEFQAVMLAWLFGPNVRIVPILCGPMLQDEQQTDPALTPGVAAFLEACHSAVAASNGRIAVIAGADLAHVGRRFGDPIEITDAITHEIQHRDEEDLAHAVAVDARAFFASVMKDANRRKVCGLGSIYAALASLEGTAQSGELISYGHAPDPAGGVVSFAGLVWR